jgi:hypothetical protein
MITNGGKEIIAKYMLGQTNAYATHLAIGCGATPVSNTETPPPLDDLLEKTYLDFEMARVPITSKGFVDNSKDFSIVSRVISSNTATITTSIPNDISLGETIFIFNASSPFNGTHIVTGINKAENQISFFLAAPNQSASGGSLRVVRTSLSLIAELPADNRYEITEIGIWPAANNAVASVFDSRNIFNFSGGWQEHAISIAEPPTISNFGTGGDINQLLVPQKVFYASTSNNIFSNVLRKKRKEGPRFLNRTLLIRGDTSRISGNPGSWIATGVAAGETPIHVHLNGVNFDISRNSPSDRLNLAFSLIDRDSTGNPIPDKVKILMEFFPNEVTTLNGFAKMEILINGQDFFSNRYKTVNIPISQGINQASEITATIDTAVGDGTETTYVTENVHKFEVGQSVTIENMAPSSYNATQAEIIAVGPTTFTIEGGATGTVTQGGNASAYPNVRLVTANDFSPANIGVCRIFVSVENIDGSISTDHYLSFDGFRIENVTTQNPIYKMTGYSVVKNADGFPIIKSQNTNDFIEFRFNLGVS